MNYIHQIKGFWIVAELHQLGHSEISLYFYLLEVWNKTTWAGQFNRLNSKVMGDLKIKSPKTLQSFRDRLAAAGVLNFRTRNGDGNVEYRMMDLGNFYLGGSRTTAKESDDLGKNYRGSGQGSGIGSGQGSGIDKINETEEKKNTLARNDFSSGSPEQSVREDPPHAPPLEDVQAFFFQQGFPELTERFMNTNAAVGWMMGGQPIRSWRAAAAGYIRKAQKDTEKAAESEKEKAAKKEQKNLQRNGAVKTAVQLLEERRQRLNQK